MSSTEETIKDTYYSDIIKLIRERPGISGTDIQKTFHPRPKITINSALQRFRRMGVVINRGSKWYPVNSNEIPREFITFAQVLLSELNSLNPEARETHLARRIQEEFQKNIGIYDNEPIVDKNLWIELQKERDKVLRDFGIRMDAENLFGEIAQSWTISQCKERISEVYDNWWHQSGGTGSNPMSPK